MAAGEFEHIRWIRDRIELDRRVLVGPGDDAAVLAATDRPTLITTDMLLDGVHFDLKTTAPRLVGRKALAVNLSDIAAMAGEPTAAAIAVGLPAGHAADLPQELFRGIEELANEFGVAIVGGDTNWSAGGLVIAITLLGHPTGDGPVLRSGAQPGDAVCVTGTLGYSLARKHLTFVPRVREAQWLHREYRLHAMMDLSDGLGGDVFHLANESGVGVVLEAEVIPIAPAVIADGRTPLDHALNDGEDFELLFTLPAAEADRLLAEQPTDLANAPVTRIGKVVAEPGVFLHSRGTTTQLSPGGFVHRW